MHRIDSATARQNMNGAGKNGFHDNADLPSQDATYLTPEWCNTVQEEIANVIEGYGIALEKPNNKQLFTTLTATFAKTINDYTDKFAQQNSRILALENRVYEYIQVGELLITTDHFASSAEVAIYKGYGTWQREAEGLALVGYSSKADSPDWTKVNGNVFGEYEHQLTVEEMPSHSHNINYNIVDIGGSGNPATDNTSSTKGGLTTDSTGGDKPHNNVQPSKIVDIWRRIA